MKHNKAALYALCALAALGAAAAILLSGADIARVLLCYPLEFTGKALRSLSLAGGALNVLAIALYAAISLIPAVLALIFARKRGHAKADCILYILSVVLFAALYLAINPGLLRYVFSADMLTIVASYQVALGILNSLIYSLVLCYAVLRIISRLAVISLKVSVISSAAFNAVQIALAGGLSSVNVSASIPFAGVLFALLALIFSRFIAESKRIKDDNDSII